MSNAKLGIALLLALTPSPVVADCVDVRPREVATLHVDSCEGSLETVLQKVADAGYPDDARAQLGESTKRVVVVTARHTGSSHKFALVDSLASCEANYVDRERRFVIEDPPQCCRDVDPPAYETAAECVLRLPTVRPLIAP